MSLIRVNDIELEAVAYGDATDPAVLLIQGLGTPLTRWPQVLIHRLLAEGFLVIVFDNRDVGLSSKMDGLGMPDIKSLMNIPDFVWPFPPLAPMMPIPYTLADMAGDAVGLLDALGVPAAHIVGASLGGMIAQLVAAGHPERCLSLTSIMSSSGNPLLPPPTTTALHALYAPLPALKDEESLVEDSIWRQKVLMSPDYPTSDADLRAMFTAEYRRHGFHPQGVIRQLSTLMASGDRRSLLSRIDTPAVVLHGEDDPLINVACGRDTAVWIPGAEFRAIPGMGHDFPAALTDEFAAAIISAAERSKITA